MTRNYRVTNRLAWDELSRLGSSSSVPWEIERIRSPRRWVDPLNWVPWQQIHDVLVIAGAGGQQAPLLAHMGHRVTVIDISPIQLERDRAVAREMGLELECIEGDMSQLSMLSGRRYDLVYQPVSSCYVPSIRRCYEAVASVVRAGAWYWSQHWNPTQIQLSTSYPWDGSAYRLDHPEIGGGPRVLRGPGCQTGPSCWHYVHPLGELLGGLCDAGFSIERFAQQGDGDVNAQPTTAAHLAAFVPPFYAMLARRHGPVPS